MEMRNSSKQPNGILKVEVQQQQTILLCNNCKNSTDSEIEKDNDNPANTNDILYGILDVPPWYISIPLGLQV